MYVQQEKTQKTERLSPFTPFPPVQNNSSCFWHTTPAGGAWWRAGDSKAVQNHRTYSPSKVIHGWRGVTGLHTPQPTVNNFGRRRKVLWEQLRFWLNRKVGHAGSGRRIPHSNVLTFSWRCSLRILRLVVKEYSEPFARKPKNPAETNLYKCFHPAGPACAT